MMQAQQSENNKMKITAKQLRNIVKEELSKIEEDSSGLTAFGNGMRTLKAVMSNLEDANDLENAELVKNAMQDLEKAMRTMREV